MRIKLNFTDVQDYSESFLSKSWFLLDPDNVKTVADLAKELIRRFGLKCKSGSLQLTLDDSLLPDWESTRILRDDDTVRLRLIQDSCHSKHKKRKRHLSNDDANWKSAADTAEPEPETCDVETSTLLLNVDKSHDCHVKELDPATCDVEMSTLLVNVDNSQDRHVKVKKKKKRKSHNHSDNCGDEDGLNVRKSVWTTAGCCKEAADEFLHCSLGNLEVSPAAQSRIDNNTDPRHVSTPDTLLNNAEHLMQPHSLCQQVDAVTVSAEDNSMSASMSPSERQASVSNLVNDEQQVKLSHSAKRRRRRHRGNKCAEKIEERDVTNDKQYTNVSAPVGNLLHGVTGSNLLAQTNHPVVSGFGCTHIVFDNTNSDDESMKVQPAAHPACDTCDSGTLKDQLSGCNTVVADNIVNSTFYVETDSRFQQRYTVSNGLTSSDVNKQSSETHLPSETKVRRRPKNTQFANVQVFCRQRLKRAASATCAPDDQDSSTVSAPLPKEKSIDIDHRQPVPKDYSQYSRLHGVPRVGDLIAYKIVELTDDYTPAMSDYQEAAVVEFNPVTNMVVLQAAADCSRTRTPGIFDISIEYEDEILTNVCQNSQSCVSWTALHDVRLLEKY